MALAYDAAVGNQTQTRNDEGSIPCHCEFRKCVEMSAFENCLVFFRVSFRFVKKNEFTRSSSNPNNNANSNFNSDPHLEGALKSNF